MKTNWQTKKLGEVCNFYNGQAHEKYIDEEGNYIVINSKFISSDGKIYKKINAPLFPLLCGDIVMVMSDVPNGKALSKCFLVDQDNMYTLNQRICVIRSTYFENKFLYYQLNRNKYFLSFDNGENQTNLRKNDILNCPLLTPSLFEQKRIVSILDSVFEKTEKEKVTVEKNLQNARELFESYLQSVFVNLDKRWIRRKLGDILKLEYGKPLEKFNRNPGGKYPVYGANGIKTRSDVFYCDKPSIIVGRKGSAGELNLTEEKFWPLDVTYFITFDDRQYILKFIYYVLSMLKLTRFAKGVKPGINRNEVYLINIKLPERLSEQKAIVAKLDALSEQTKKFEDIYKQKLAVLDELKKSILQEAFAGEL